MIYLVCILFGVLLALGAAWLVAKKPEEETRHWCYRPKATSPQEED